MFHPFCKWEGCLIKPKPFAKHKVIKAKHRLPLGESGVPWWTGEIVPMWPAQMNGLCMEPAQLPQGLHITGICSSVWRKKHLLHGWLWGKTPGHMGLTSTIPNKPSLCFSGPSWHLLLWTSDTEILTVCESYQSSQWITESGVLCGSWTQHTYLFHAICVHFEEGKCKLMAENTEKIEQSPADRSPSPCGVETVQAFIQLFNSFWIFK